MTKKFFKIFSIFVLATVVLMQSLNTLAFATDNDEVIIDGIHYSVHPQGQVVLLEPVDGVDGVDGQEQETEDLTAEADINSELEQ